MALDTFLGSLASVAVPTPPPAGVSAPHGDLNQPGQQFASADKIANFEPFLNMTPGTSPVSAAIPPNIPPPSAIRELSRPPLNTLGNDVLNSLERFGSRVQGLQTIGVDAGKSTNGLTGGPAQNQVTAPGSPQDPMADVKQGYTDIFNQSMKHQQHMYGLMIEVNLGHTVASNVTSTAKTLLTQSG